MATDSSPSSAVAPASVLGKGLFPLDGNVWRAPLVPVALVLTAGIVLDRYQPLPLAGSLVAAVLCLVACGVTFPGPRRGLPLVYLGLAGVSFGAAYHHFRRDTFPPDDVGHWAPADPWPVQMRGVLDEEPLYTPPAPADPLRFLPRPERTATVLRATHLRRDDEWQPVSGLVRLLVEGALPGFHTGDEVEVVGRLSAPQGPANPGEFDYASFLRDQGIRSILVVRKTADGVTRLARGWPGTWAGGLAVVRGWGQLKLAQTLPEECSGVAMALLLGEGSTMTREDWDKYVRTGVIHVLAISGQHLVVLAWGLWGVLCLAGVRQRKGALVVSLFLLGYALLTGGQPPALRSAVMVCVACGGLVLRRRSVPANAFALGWLVVALLQPTDLFGTGCLLSFLSVAILYWGLKRDGPAEEDPVDQLIEQGRPAWLRALRAGAGALVESYRVSLVIWLAVTPLAAARSHVVAPIGILLGPPLTLLTSVALFAGFFLLLASAVWTPLAAWAALPVRWSLAGCEYLVDLTDAWPVSHYYVGDVPEWWLWLFYLALLALLTQKALRRYRHWGAAGGLAWLCVGLLAGAARLPADELRCTFLAVGHGGCTVIEVPDGRTLLYDAGSLGGPDVTRRQIAPFLWSRGIRRLDEVFLSHADTDHFNGLPALLDRFAVGQVSCTPTFADKQIAAVRHTLTCLGQRSIPVRIVKAGDRLAAGDVDLEVLHPPAEGPAGNENARSLVLRVRHAGHTLLLTGDLEGPGLARVLKLPAPKVDVFMAPHHGSRLANTPDLAAWARPRVVVACQGPPVWPAREPDPFSRAGVPYLGTWPHGAVTVRSHASGLVIETFVTGQRLVLRSQPGPR